MECSRCGATLGPGVRECPDCGNQVYGNDFVYASITVTWEQARKGGLHTVEMRDLVNPLKVRIRPGTRTGDKYRVPGAMFVTADESMLLAPVEVTVHVEPRPLWQSVMAVLLCLLLVAGAGVGIHAAWEGMNDRPAVQVSTTPTQPRQTTAPTQPSTAAAETETTEPETTVPQQPESIIMNYALRPLLRQLSEDQLTNLEAIYQALMNFEASVTLPCEITVEEINYLIQVLHFECPELMQFDLSQSGMFYYDTTTNIVNKYELAYVLSQAEYTEMYDACVEVIDRLVAETQGMTDWEKERYVFDYITANCSYDLYMDLAGTAYGTLVQKIAKCDGISLATKWILEEMGITCVVAGGAPKEGDIGHVWNYVLLDGAYYGLDVTADVFGEDNEGPILFCAYNVSTELLEEDFILDPVFTEYVQTPVVTTMEKSYHVQNGGYITSGSGWERYAQAKFETACQSGGEFRFQFESEADYESCKAELNQFLNDVWNNGGFPGQVSWSYWYHDGFRVVCVRVTKA